MPSGQTIKTEAEFWEIFWRRVSVGAPDECWLWTGKPADTGYGQVAIPLCMRGTGKRDIWTTHRLSWVSRRGPIPPGLHVLHTCDVRPCVNPAHLYLGTQADNVRDMIVRGRDGFIGERNPHARLTAKDVGAVRRMRSDGDPQQRIADFFRVSRGAIEKITSGKNWRHIGDAA